MFSTPVHIVFFVCLNGILPLTFLHCINSLNTCYPALSSLLQHSTEEWETAPSPQSPAMKCLSSIPVLARKVLQKPCCVFFTISLWPARVFCTARYCHVALKFCIKLDKSLKIAVMLSKQGGKGGRKPVARMQTWYHPGIYFWGSYVTVCVKHKIRAQHSRPQFTFHTVPWVTPTR